MCVHAVQLYWFHHHKGTVLRQFPPWFCHLTATLIHVYLCGIHAKTPRNQNVCVWRSRTSYLHLLSTRTAADVFVPVLTECMTPTNTKLSLSCVEDMGWWGSVFLWPALQSQWGLLWPFQALAISTPAFDHVNLSSVTVSFCLSCWKSSSQLLSSEGSMSCTYFSYDFLSFLLLPSCPMCFKFSMSKLGEFT